MLLNDTIDIIKDFIETVKRFLEKFLKLFYIHI